MSSRCYHSLRSASFLHVAHMEMPSSICPISGELLSGFHSNSGFFNENFRPFGLDMLRLLLEYAQYADCPLNFPERSSLSEIAHDFLIDLTHGFLQYSLHNQKINAHAHLTIAAKKMVRDGYYYHDFCDECSSPTCPANANFCRLILICMHYLNQVYSLCDQME